MTERGRGRLVNVASVAGKTVAANMATYCGTKHAIVAITETARVELRGTGVGLTLVLPSFTNTELTTGAAKPRFVDMPEADDVAGAIVAAVARGRDDVYVPGIAGPLVWLLGVLPSRVAGAVQDALGAHDMFANVDHAARRSYVDRYSQR